MMRLQARLSDIAAIAAIFVLGACSHSPVPEPTPPAPPPVASLAPSPAAMPPAALQVEGLPPLPMALLQEAQGYDRVSGHVFVDWHPVLRCV